MVVDLPRPVTLPVPPTQCGVPAGQGHGQAQGHVWSRRSSTHVTDQHTEPRIHQRVVGWGVRAGLGDGTLENSGS